jgi:hypothetical protein
MKFTAQSQWPRGLRRRSAVARLLGLWVWIAPGTWISVSCEGCVSSGLSSRAVLPTVVCRVWSRNLSSRAVLPTVVCRVWSRNLVNEEATAWVGPQGYKKKINFQYFSEFFSTLNLWYCLDFQYFSILYIIFQNFTPSVNYFKFSYKLFLFPYAVGLICHINTFLSGV